LQLALIVNSDLEIEVWQLASLEGVEDLSRRLKLILVCNNPPKRRFKLKHLSYYLLSSFAKFRISYLRKVKIPDRYLAGAKLVEFTAINQGAWQSIPDEVFNNIPKDTVIIRFGMNLLEINEKLLPSGGIVSFHHGDSHFYRGRPPAYYEIKNRESVVGVTLQKLSNTLDAGEILRQAHTSCKRYSYIKTLRSLYKSGIPLLANYLQRSNNSELASVKFGAGRNYRLPLNLDVTIFLLVLFIEKLKRLRYGLFQDKLWSIGYVANQHFPITESYQITTFQLVDHDGVAGESLADPVGILDDAIFCERISKWNNRGSISSIVNQKIINVNLPGGKHYSFPTLINCEGEIYLLLETAQHSPPCLFRLNASGSPVGSPESIKGLEEHRLLDPVHFMKDGLHFIFGNSRTSKETLELFVSKNLLGPYRPHLESPILSSPIGARMAGPIIEVGKRLYRVGQDCGDSYGNGVIISEIVHLSQNSYREKRISRVEMKDFGGPHSFLLVENRLYFDFYKDVYSPLAGLRRALHKLSVS